MSIAYLQKGDSASFITDIGQGSNVGVTYAAKDGSLLSVSGSSVTSLTDPKSELRTYVVVQDSTTGKIYNVFEVVLVPSTEAVTTVQSGDKIKSVVQSILNSITRVSTASTPAGLAATVVSSSQISLSWGASTNAVSYNLYRNGVKVVNTASTSFSDTGLTASTSYSYTVSALNSSGIESAQSAPVSATTSPSGGTAGVFASGWNTNPNRNVIALTHDSSGNFYALDNNNSTIYKLGPTGSLLGTVDLTGYSLSNLIDVIVIGNYLYVTNTNAYQVIRVDLTSGAKTAASFQNSMYVMAYNSLADSAHLYLSTYNGAVFKVNLDLSGAVFLFYAPFTQVVGMDMDNAGNFYFATAGYNTVYAISPSGATLGSWPLTTPYAVAFDPDNGNVYAESNGSQILYRLDPGGSTTQIASSLGHVQGIDYFNRFIYVLEQTTGTITKYTP